MNRRIVYVQYNNPAAYPPLTHSARILADAGWDVLVLGISDAATHSLRFPSHMRINTKLLPPVKLGWRRLFYFVYFCGWVLWNTFRWRAAWVYASDANSAPAALLAGHLLGCRILYHEHDAPQATTRFAKFNVAARDRLVKRASLFIFPNAARAERFTREHAVAEKTRVVWNCPERDEVLPLPVDDVLPLRLLYHGSLVPARLPLTVLDALTELPSSVCLRVVGYETVGHVGYMESFLECARQAGIRDRVEWLGQVPSRAELLALARECYIGLSLMPMHSEDWNEQSMAGASNKPFDYMACGLGLIVSDLPDWRAIFVEPGFARACDSGNAASIAGAVRWYLEQSVERERARAKILSEWNYEMQFAPVREELERA